MLSILILASQVAHAQDTGATEDPSESARFQWGPLKFTPGIAISNVGIDNNVFNDPDHQLQDTTAAVGPAVNLWTNLGRLRISEKSAGQYLYFKQFENQRSWNTSHSLKFDLPLNRIHPFAEGTYVNARDRPGYEIDSRARASTNAVTFGSELRLSGKSTAVLSVNRTNIAFDQHETFLGSELATSLNRRSDTESAQLRYKMTPLTTLVTTADAVQDRFDYDRLRNTDSYSVRSGFEFKPFALISGKAAVGFRHFNVLNDTVQDFNGLVASVDAKYNITTSTQLNAKVNRDTQFSFDDLLPYYTLTDTNLNLKQRIRSTWEVTATGARQSLAYHGLTTESAALDRTDRGTILGLGIGYLVGETVRVGFDVNYYRRESEIAGRNYDGLRAGASVSYGLQK
jgi:hypothetical protein